MKHLRLLFLMMLCAATTAQETDWNQEEVRINPLIDGTLLLPSAQPTPLVIIIAGSGPTDRNGNQNMMTNNSLRFLAEGLYGQGIASYRYDKRIVKQLRQRSIDEKNIRFDDFIDDALAVVQRFKEDPRFNKIVVAGHSQGSLVGMVAARDLADGFVSIAGAGQEIDDVIIDQLAQQAPGLVDNARSAFDDLRVNGVAQNYSPGLASIFRKEIQPFIYTWMQYNPQEEIAKLNMPVLIVNGTKDLQVQQSEAEKLHQAFPKATYKVIENMNHVLKVIEGNDLENSKSYNEHKRPVSPELIQAVSDFVKQ